MPSENKKMVKVETATPVLSKGQKFQAELMAELDESMTVMGVDMTDYGKKCVVNAIGALIMYCQTNDISLNDINPVLLRTQLQNVGLTELNFAGMPSEAYFDLRKSKVTVRKANSNGEVKEEEKEIYNISMKPQGAGNEKLVRKYGVGLKKNTGLHQAILIHEGDEVTMPQCEGSIVTPLRIETKFENLNNKVIGVAYVVEKEDGTEDYLIATREGIKPNIVAQIRQNTLYTFKQADNKWKVDTKARDAFYEKLDADAEKMNVDELLKAYKDYVNPTYTSGGSKEAMILRKMKNNALKYYPKEYDNSFIKTAVEDMFEEKDESVMEKPKVAVKEDVIEKVETEIMEEPPVKDAPADFEIKDVESKSDAEEKPVEKEKVEEPKDSDPF